MEEWRARCKAMRSSYIWQVTPSRFTGRTWGGLLLSLLKWLLYLSAHVPPGLVSLNPEYLLLPFQSCLVFPNCGFSSTCRLFSAP